MRKRDVDEKVKVMGDKLRGALEEMGGGRESKQ